MDGEDTKASLVKEGFIVAVRNSTQSLADAEATLNTKNRLKEDVEALANLIYDIFKERQDDANVNHDQNPKSYAKKERQS